MGDERFIGEEKVRLALASLEGARGTIEEFQARLKKDIRNAIDRGIATKYAELAVNSLEVFQNLDDDIRNDTELVAEYETYFYELLVSFTEFLELLQNGFDNIHWTKEEADGLNKLIDHADMHFSAYFSLPGDLEEFSSAAIELKVSLATVK